LLGQPSFNAYFEIATRSNGTDLISTMNGLFQTGGFLGTLCLPVVADKVRVLFFLVTFSRLPAESVLMISRSSVENGPSPFQQFSSSSLAPSSAVASTLESSSSFVSLQVLVLL